MAEHSQQEAADLKIDLAQGRDVILLDGVDVILHERQAGAVVFLAFLHIAERFDLPHGVGAEVPADALDDDIARIVQQKGEKRLNAAVNQRHERDLPHAREISLHGTVGEQAEQERHEDGRDGREKVGHKKQHDRRAVSAEIAFHSGLPFFLSNT